MILLVVYNDDILEGGKGSTGVVVSVAKDDVWLENIIPPLLSYKLVVSIISMIYIEIEIMALSFSLVNKTTMIAGRRGAGKTVLAKQLIEDEKQKFSKIFLFSPTEAINRDYADLVPQNCIFDDWNEKWGNSLLEKLAKTPKEELKPILIVFDDMGSERSMENSRIFTRFFTRGRHTMVSILSLNQYIFQLSKICRSNLDFVIVGSQNAQSVDILETEFNANLEPKAFRQLYHKAIENFGFMIIKNSSVKDSTDQNQMYGVLRATI